jgi:hypothetical protein
MGDDLIDAALERLRATPPRGHNRVLRRGEMIGRSSTNAMPVSMPAKPQPGYVSATPRRGRDRHQSRATAVWSACRVTGGVAHSPGLASEQTVAIGVLDTDRGSVLLEAADAAAFFTHAEPAVGARMA